MQFNELLYGIEYTNPIYSICLFNDYKTEFVSPALFEHPL